MKESKEECVENTVNIFGVKINRLDFFMKIEKMKEGLRNESLGLSDSISQTGLMHKRSEAIARGDSPYGWESGSHFTITSYEEEAHERMLESFRDLKDFGS